MRRGETVDGVIFDNRRPIQTSIRTEHFGFKSSIVDNAPERSADTANPSLDAFCKEGTEYHVFSSIGIQSSPGGIDWGHAHSPKRRKAKELFTTRNVWMERGKGGSKRRAE